MLSDKIPSVAELVAELPEIYQPIFGHDEYSNRSSRSTDKRLEELLPIHDALGRVLGRSLRVLDLGCTQGWFSFNLAKAGASVIGLDISAANINMCNRLAPENRDLKLRFELHEIEQIAQQLMPGKIDLVLGLSVLHHVCHHNTKERARELTP